MSPRPVACALCLLIAEISSPHGIRAQEAPSYTGIEADAPWRTEASERIDKRRKANLVISVRDASNEPVKDAEISIRQQQHAFRFSSDVDPDFFADPKPDSTYSADDREKYRATAAELFNLVYPFQDRAAESDAVESWARAHELLKPAASSKAIDLPSDFGPDNFLPPKELADRLDALAKKKKPIRVLHYRFAADPADPGAVQLQANYTRDFLTLLFSHPSVVEIGIAGFWAPAIPDGRWALYDWKWQPRPVGDVYLKLVKKQWWTDETALTNAAGECSVRCFLGEYRISVSAGGQMITLNATVPAEGGKVKVKLTTAAARGH